MRVVTYTSSLYKIRTAAETHAFRCTKITDIREISELKCNQDRRRKNSLDFSCSGWDAGIFMKILENPFAVLGQKKGQLRPMFSVLNTVQSFFTSITLIKTKNDSGNAILAREATSSWP